MRLAKIFITHGHELGDRDAMAALIRSGTIRHGAIPAVFEDFGHPGEYVPTIIEALPARADAAIIMATPDDVGNIAGSGRAAEPRARQNVWIELGLFWGRFGRQRTLLVVKGDVEIPSNLGGLLYARYHKDVGEISEKIEQFISGLTRSHARGIAEVVYASTDRTKRESDWFELHESAERLLTITGTAMGAIQRSLPMVIDQLRRKPELRIEFVVVDPLYIGQNELFFERYHGRGTRKDNASFFTKLADCLAGAPAHNSRVNVYLHSGIMNFSAVAADAPELGSEMLAQLNLPGAREAGFNYPRTLLRKRIHGDLFDVHWNAVVAVKTMSHRVLSGGEIKDYARQLPV